ncbi:DUF6273 domain-containing protein, partial [Oceanirhabdus seepicola]
MKKKLSIILVILLILTNMGLGSTTKAYVASNTPLESMNPGDKIIFADKEWIILDPDVGYIILASNDGDRQRNSTDNNDYASSTIRAYLNGDFLNSLKEENKDLITEVIWNCGPEKIVKIHKYDYDWYYSVEVSERVRDKVGLISYSEYINYSKYFNPKGGVLEPIDWNYSWWLMTPNSGVSDLVWYVGTYGDLYHYGYITYSLGVRPALYLKSGIFVSAVTYAGNGSDAGTVPSDSNNYIKGSSASVLGNGGNLTRAGYTFVGWNTKADGRGIDYAVGSTFKMGSENETLYAKWTQSSEKEIIGFTLAEQTGAADIKNGNHTVEIEVDNGKDVTNLTPTIS